MNLEDRSLKEMHKRPIQRHLATHKKLLSRKNPGDPSLQPKLPKDLLPQKTNTKTTVFDQKKQKLIPGPAPLNIT